MNQQQIDDLINDSDDQISKSSLKKPPTSNPNPTISPSPQAQPNNYQQSNSYANQDFQDYEQSKRIQSSYQSQSESQSASISYGQSNNRNRQKQKQKEKEKEKGKKGKELAAIKEEEQYLRPDPPKKSNQNYIKPALELRSQTGFQKKGKMTNTDKVYLPHNYARLEEREKELLLTTLTEENKRLKAELLDKDNNYKKLEQKYKMAMQEKVEHAPSAKQVALQKQITSLRTKLLQMTNLNKIAQQRQKYKTKISKNPGTFIPEEEVNRRQTELLELIDKLKNRLVESDQSMGILQKKINEGAEYNDQLHRKMKRVEQLQYKLQKMSQQAETDREYIQILKQKIKQLQNEVQTEKDKLRKQQLEMKRIEMGQLTHADIVKELKEVRKEKELLEKSLKEMSATMINNVRKNYQNVGAENRIEDSGELLRTNIR